jgi:hypothetical protein
MNKTWLSWRIMISVPLVVLAGVRWPHMNAALQLQDTSFMDCYISNIKDVLSGRCPHSRCFSECRRVMRHRENDATSTWLQFNESELT